jgi:hypothetical protein
MRQTELLRVKKQNVPVELALPGSPPRPVEVFLAEHQAHADRRQHVLDLLEQAAAFLPARDFVSGIWEVFNKEALLWIKVPLGASGIGGEGGEELFDYQKAVRVELLQGVPIDGELLYSLPEPAARINDYLNQPGRFFRLWQAEHLLLVNKAFVLRIVEKA